MTQEDRELLLKDLCARLPYGLKCDRLGKIERLVSVKPEKVFCITLDNGEYMPNDYCIDDVKPYLRSFKSMTKDERSEYYKRCKICHYKHAWKCGRNQYGETLYRKGPMSYTAFYRTPEALDYLNSIHVDYRGLIKKGLAIKANRNTYSTFSFTS